MEWFSALPDWIKFVLILAVFFVIYLIYMVLNYNRVKKQVLAMQNSLKIGDTVMTQSGLYGMLVSLDKSTARLKIADNLVILIDRFSIKNVVKGGKRRMKGIVLVSHGDMAKGMVHSASFFYGDEIPQLDFCGLRQGQSPEEFAEQLKETIGRVDTGDGVVVLADLFGGTPCNQAILCMNDTTECIAGMNFPMLLELLSDRESEVPGLEGLAEKGKSGIYDVKEFLAASADEEDD